MESGIPNSESVKPTDSAVWAFPLPHPSATHGIANGDGRILFLFFSFQIMMVLQAGSGRIKCALEWKLVLPRFTQI